ncbi:MAG: family 78 glycoside hydrolase catalytic domain, partial [Solirubrobacterales bacterium]
MSTKRSRSGSNPVLVLCAGLALSCVAAPARALAPAAAAAPRVVGLRTEYKENPLGIDARKPRLSWRIESGARGVLQSAYEIRVTHGGSGSGKVVWDSGKVASDASIHRVYEGPALRSGERYDWQVRVWDGSGSPSAWSAPASWEMGLLEAADWKASWIEPGLAEDVTKSGPSPIVRREFQLKGAVARARAYVTSHGLYEMHLNGRRVGDELFTPGWTSYNKRLQYQSFDVTPLLKPGPNAVGVQLGNGWYRGDLAWEGRRNLYGDRLSLLVQIRVTYQDGREELVTSDAQWKASTGPILMSEIYHGETYDARLEKPGWTSPGFDDKDWAAVRVAAGAKDNLITPAGPPVRRIQELKPVRIFKTPGGDTVADLGQNMVGWVRLKVQGPAGTKLTVRHAEVLDKDGNFYTANLRKAKATLEYTLKGGGVETFEPRFTFFGFRYVAVAGFPGELAPDAVTGIVIHSQMRPTGEFETSKPLVNQLQKNILWGQKGNFLDVPTDCPQRDERLGWTGDAEAFFPTAAFNMDVAGFFTKWMKDVAADQFPNGSVPHVVPNVLPQFEGRDPGGAAGWADAATIIPWSMYLAYGDTRVLETQYESMSRWVGYQQARAGDDSIWDGDFHFGDWLAFASAGMAANDYPGAT